MRNKNIQQSGQPSVILNIEDIASVFGFIVKIFNTLGDVKDIGLSSSIDTNDLCKNLSIVVILYPGVVSGYLEEFIL